MDGLRMSVRLSEIEEAAKEIYKKPPLICVPLGGRFPEKLEEVIKEHINSKDFINEINRFKSRTP